MAQERSQEAARDAAAAGRAGASLRACHLDAVKALDDPDRSMTVRVLKVLIPPRLRGLLRRLFAVLGIGQGRDVYRAYRASARKDWPRAVTAWREAIEAREVPRPQWQTQYAWALYKTGRYEAAARAQAAAVQGDPTKAFGWRRNTVIAAKLPDWETVVASYRALAELGASDAAPTAPTTRLGRALDGMADADGEPKAKEPYALGRALQALERYDEALAAFGRALRLLESVDKPWALEAHNEWEFRWEYCRVRVEDVERQHRALDVEVAPVEGDASQEQATAGRFAAEVIHTGVLLTGWVTDPEAVEVAVRVDGQPIRSVGLNHDSIVQDAYAPRFRYAIKHPTLDRFPPRSHLSVWVDDAPLAAPSGAPAVELVVPHGDGALLGDDGPHAELTKKGTLVGTVGPVSDGPISALESYARARRTFRERLGRELFLVYGTLLGCVRDGDFIAGDDDVDLGYLSDAEDPATVKAETLGIVEELLAQGYDVGCRVSGGLFKLYIEERELDIYPVWFANERAWAYSDIDARRADFEPLATTDFKGTEVTVPGDVATVLAGTYGPDWRTPSPGFRHYRSAAVRRKLSRTYLTPNEARELRSRQQRARDGGNPVGRFLIGHSPDRPRIITAWGGGRAGAATAATPAGAEPQAAVDATTEH